MNSLSAEGDRVAHYHQIELPSLAWIGKNIQIMLANFPIWQIAG
jgi:hypothetical protein